jgi:hypothetical protein
MLYPSLIAILILFNSSRIFAFLDKSSMDSMTNVKALILPGLKKTMESMVHHQSAHLIRLVLVILWMRTTQKMMTQVAKVTVKIILI